MKKDYSISLARFVAMCFVIICHIMQKEMFKTIFFGVQIEWAYWFNVGVQMFLFLSGYLYGGRKNIEISLFYKKSFAKILIDYYIFIITVSVGFYILPKTSISIISFLKMFTLCGGVTEVGLGHLWFIKTILFCYLLTPIFAAVINDADNDNTICFCIRSAALIILTQTLLMIHFKGFSAPWTVCFLFGMIYRKAEDKSNKLTLNIDILSTIMCLVFLAVQFRIDYFSNIRFSKYASVLYNIFCDYGHALLGIVLVIAVRFIHKSLFFGKIKRYIVLDWSDKYSYDVYLVHTVFIMSPYACAGFIQNRIIAVTAAVFLTIISAIALRITSDLIKTLPVKNKYKKTETEMHPKSI